MYLIHQAKQHIVRDMKSALGRGVTITPGDLSWPPEESMGDLSFPCFSLAKGLKRPPHEIASELAAKMAPKGYLKKIEALGPYVNFFLQEASFGQEVLEEIMFQGDRYGNSTVGEGKRVMVEYANLNTHKDVHIGHLRNMLVGHAAVNILRAQGYDVIPVTYINDLGANVAACIWALRHLAPQEQIPAGVSERLAFLQRMYQEGTARAEEDTEVKQAISKIQRDLEVGRGSELGLWRKTHRWSLKGLRAVFSELGLPLEAWYLEHELILDTQRLIEELKEKGIVKESQGAWVVDLAEEGLGVNLLVKSDGTLLYNAKDLVLARRKEDSYHPHRSLYVIDMRQSLVMQQLFATLRRMGVTRELIHLSYEFLTLKEGAMSSRKGNIIRYDELRDGMLAQALEETTKRHPTWSARTATKVARTVTFAALRFSILKQQLGKKIIFDRAEALSFDGCTGPYLLYTIARIEQLLAKAPRGRKPIAVASLLTHRTEHRLLLHLARYPDAVAVSGEAIDVSSLAEALFGIAQAFSQWYAAVPVAQAEHAELANARLALAKSTGTVLRNGLRILGIATVKEM